MDGYIITPRQQRRDICHCCRRPMMSRLPPFAATLAPMVPLRDSCSQIFAILHEIVSSSASRDTCFSPRGRVARYV